MLFSNFLLLLFLLLDIFIVSSGFFKGRNEVIKDPKELVTLSCCWIFREEATHSVKLEIENNETVCLQRQNEVIKQNKRSIS